MDDTDAELIAALRRNGRESVSDLAVRMGVTRATVRSRLEKLRGGGVILGFTAVLKSDSHDRPVRSMTLIEIEGKGIERIIKALDGMPEIQTIHVTNGRWDLIIEMGTETLADLDEALRRVRNIQGVANSQTNLYLSTVRSQRLVGFPGLPGDT
ncbi:MAG: Lrp/AsnC family transcriptional regulator [Alphaproteobacteria bacterium]|nr:Lrp/AsnC family transcriptional regulator [Alphaproteobacteria bacterium]